MVWAASTTKIEREMYTDAYEWPPYFFQQTSGWQPGHVEYASGLLKEINATSLRKLPYPHETYDETIQLLQDFIEAVELWPESDEKDIEDMVEMADRISAYYDFLNRRDGSLRMIEHWGHGVMIESLREDLTCDYFKALNARKHLAWFDDRVIDPQEVADLEADNLLYKVTENLESMEMDTGENRKRKRSDDENYHDPQCLEADTYLHRLYRLTKSMKKMKVDNEDRDMTDSDEEDMDNEESEENEEHIHEEEDIHEEDIHEEDTDGSSQMVEANGLDEEDNPDTEEYMSDDGYVDDEESLSSDDEFYMDEQ